MTAEPTSAEPKSAAGADAGRESFTFQAEVGRLLHIVANALYSEREVFLRELISNASDACDKLRYAALTDPALQTADTGLEVRISVDKPAKTMTVADAGIGMTRQELIDNLGTIARSGTTAFLESLAKSKADAASGAAAPSLIGQFGVGFYAAYMVADRVAVTSRRAGSTEAWTWDSDGKGSFTLEPATVEAAFRGTRIVLHLKADAEEFLDELRIKGIVRRYSDHVALPVRLGAGEAAETINSASALWTRPRAEVSESDHENFFRHVSGGFGKPWLTMHFRAEGTFEYTGLLYVPDQKPFDLLDPSRKSRVRLYVRRVFITDDVEGLVPPYLRFLKGVVDTADLPLNVSREMLQRNPLVERMRAGIVKRTLDALKKRAAEDATGYAAFWESFGPVLKEGLYEDFEQRDALLELARFRSTAGEGWVDLATYVQRMKPGQDAIYTIAGADVAALRKSPQIEAFLAKGVEVLLLTDPIDEFWAQSIGMFKDKPFKSATRGGIDLSKVESAGEASKAEPEKAGEAAPEIDGLVALLKLSLKDAVKDVRVSKRLTDSPVCLVADEGDLDLNLERLLRQHKRLDAAVKRVLEVNPAHALIRSLAARVKAKGAEKEAEDAALLLLDQALIMEGEPVSDPVAFSRRLSALVAKGLAA